MTIPQMVVVVMVVRVMKSAEKQRLPLGLASGGFLSARSLNVLRQIPRWVSALRSQNLCEQPFGQADAACSHQHWHLPLPRI